MQLMPLTCTMQGAPPQQGRFQNPQRMVTVDTGAQQGQPGMGPILLLPPEFLAQQQGGFGASAGPFMPMHLMGGGFPGQPLRPGQAFGQPQQPPAPRTREVRSLLFKLAAVVNHEAGAQGQSG